MKMHLFKTQAQVVEMIHAEFDSAQDRLLAEAKNIIATTAIDIGDKALDDKAARLERLGFTMTKVVVEANEKNKVLQANRYKVGITEYEARRIEYYKSTYPFLKFLTESELDRICDKYKLIYAPVSNYKEAVPDKNLAEIERAQPLHVADQFVKTFRLIPLHPGTQHTFNLLGHPDGVFTQDQINEIAKSANALLYAIYGKTDIDVLENDTWLYRYISNKTIGTRSDQYWWQYKVEVNDRTGLFIAAPPSHFDLKDLSRKGKGFFARKFFEPKDPIVFRYVQGGVQVLSKWGIEANDSALINAIDN